MPEKKSYRKTTGDAGANSFVKEINETPYGLISEIKKGIDKSKLLILADKLSLPVSEFAKLLPVSERTLRRYEKTRRLSPDLTERIIKIARLYAKGLVVFGERESFLHWLKSESKILPGKPIELLDTNTGIDLVMDELGRIEHGIYA